MTAWLWYFRPTVISIRPHTLPYGHHHQQQQQHQQQRQEQHTNWETNFIQGTVILVRHSESENVREYERAIYRIYRPCLVLAKIGGRLLPIFMHCSVKVAIKKIRGSNATSDDMRMEILQPLSVKTNRTIHYWHSQENVSKVTKRILALFKKGHMCGKKSWWRRNNRRWFLDLPIIWDVAQLGGVPRITGIKSLIWHGISNSSIKSHGIHPIQMEIIYGMIMVVSNAKVLIRWHWAKRVEIILQVVRLLVDDRWHKPIPKKYKM